MTVPSLARRPPLLVFAFLHPRIFRLGWAEAYGDGRTYDDDPWSRRSRAYDAGRDLRRLGRA
jgi:hypothetical protein